MRVSVRTKLMGTSAVLLAMIGVVGVVGIVSVNAVNDQGTRMLTQATLPLHYLEQINADLLDRARATQQGDTFPGVASVQDSVDTYIANMDTAIDANVSAYEASNPNSAEQAQMDQVKQDLQAYRDDVVATRVYSRAGNAAPADLITTAKTARANLMKLLSTMITDKVDQARQIDTSIDDTYRTAVLLTVAAILVAVMLGFGISLFLARRLTRDVRQVQAMMRSISENDVASLEAALSAFAANDLTCRAESTTAPIEKYSSDEVGQAARAANEMLERLSAAMGSYEASRLALVGAVSEVRDASGSVAATSDTVSSIATQVSSASGQVASTVGQVAAGAGDQARSASDAAQAMQELVGDVGRMGSGAGRTAANLADTVATVEQMGRSIQSAADASSQVDDVASRAAAAADHGTRSVRETVAGMARIKDAVEGAAVKVTELGAKGDQIGAIVETIDDIAEQTNLLALNAAIEAARAGEQGKGFAVVADEVRKLAERSSLATKEIATLIDEVQRGTAAAVEAMRTGAAEVEQGTVLADRAGQSLDEIADAVTATKVAADSITTAVTALTGASASVMSGIEEIGRVARDNASLGDAMSRTADSTSMAVTSIAAIAEENSAAAEEVSAATEEMSAQAQELVASAESLAMMASRLDQLVARFRTDQESALTSIRRDEEQRVRRAA